MIKISDKILHRLGKYGINEKDFFHYFNYFEDKQMLIMLLQSMGLPLIKHKKKYILKTALTPINKDIFCIFDLETNGSKPDSSQIIEIAIIKYQNNRIIDTYESLVYADDIPKNISEIINIYPSDLINAPSLKKVLNEVKVFIKDHTLIAHNANFDYKYLSRSLENYHLGVLKNPYLCSIDLAKRTIKSEKYGLSYLNETLNLNKHTQYHRALFDTQITTELFKILLSKLPLNIKTSEDLIRFSKSDNKI